MPQLIVLALVGGAAWYGYKAIKREMDRVGRQTREAEVKKQSPVKLTQDEDGVFRPKDNDDS